MTHEHLTWSDLMYPQLDFLSLVLSVLGNGSLSLQLNSCQMVAKKRGGGQDDNTHLNY